MATLEDLMLLGIDLRMYPSFPGHTILASYCIETTLHAITSSSPRADERTAEIERRRIDSEKRRHTTA